jgi:hypothetical protein
MLHAPTNLVAKAVRKGLNTLAFEGNNGSGPHSSVRYEIWRLYGDTAPFEVVATVVGEGFGDTDATPGAYYNYKVRAIAGDKTSDFSNVAVVYGSI